MSRSQTTFEDFSREYKEGELEFLQDGDLHACLRDTETALCDHEIDESKELLFRSPKVNSAKSLCKNCLSLPAVQEYIILYGVCGALSEDPVAQNIDSVLPDDRERHELVQDAACRDTNENQHRDRLHEVSQKNKKMEEQRKQKEKERLLNHATR